MQMIWIETPSNPAMKIVDIEAVAKVAHQHPGVFVVVDNTFMSSYFQVISSVIEDIEDLNCRDVPVFYLAYVGMQPVFIKSGSDY